MVINESKANLAQFEMKLQTGAKLRAKLGNIGKKWNNISKITLNLAMLSTSIDEVLCLMGPPLPVGTGSTDMEKGATCMTQGRGNILGLWKDFPNVVKIFLNLQIIINFCFIIGEICD